MKNVHGGHHRTAFAPKIGCEPTRSSPHPDDEADVRAGLDEVARGELLSAEESAAYLRSLLGEGQPSGE